MFENFDCNRIRDKLVLAVMCIIFFSFLYSTAEKKEVNFDNSNIFESFLYSFSVQMFEYDLKNVYNRAFVFTIIQIILSYIIIVA